LRQVGSEMYIIGLTGNIATGKSTVAAMLASLGAYVIDADELAHWAMRAGTDACRRIVERFGAQVLGRDGEINRAELASLVFADPAALHDLEAIVHPVVVGETLRRLAVCERPVAVVEAIKLFEAQMHTHCDTVWVVTCGREQQVERLLSMRHLTVEQAELRIGAQPPASAKVNRAHVVIDNSRGLAETWTQVLRAWRRIPGAPSVPEDTPWAGPAGGNTRQSGGRSGGRQGTQKQAILRGERGGCRR